MGVANTSTPSRSSQLFLVLKTSRGLRPSARDASPFGWATLVALGTFCVVVCRYLPSVIRDQWRVIEITFNQYLTRTSELGSDDLTLAVMFQLLLYPTAIGSEPQDPSINSVAHWKRVMQGHAAVSARDGDRTHTDLSRIIPGAHHSAGH